MSHLVSRLWVVLLFLLLLTACTSHPLRSFETLALPEPEAGPCCWQALFAAELNLGDQQQKLMAAVSFESEAYSLVLLDQLGQRLYSLTAREGVWDEYQSPLLGGGDLPTPALKTLHTLSWWSLDSWPQNHAWLLRAGEHSRELFKREWYGERLMLRVGYEGRPQMQPVSAENPLRLGETLLLEHRAIDFKLRLITRQWQWLSPLKNKT